ncbi:hypothetical protein Tco_0591164 [Tanacetum coccineum]
MPRKSSKDYKNERHYMPIMSHEFRSPIKEKLRNLEERYIHEGRVVFDNFTDLNYVRSLFHFVEFECLLEINEQVCPRFILEFYSQYRLSYYDEGAYVFTYRWRLDELAYGIPSDGQYQINPPSIKDIISSIRIEREGQVRRIRHEKEIDVHDYQIVTREIIPTLKPLEEIIQENSENQEGIVAREEVVIPLLCLPPSINHPRLISTMMMTMGMTKEPRVQALLPPFVMSIP